jgi:hypothetical protein
MEREGTGEDNGKGSAWHRRLTCSLLLPIRAQDRRQKDIRKRVLHNWDEAQAVLQKIEAAEDAPAKCWLSPRLIFLK